MVGEPTMAAKFTLEQLRIASPCPASWDEMQGDDRARFCPECRKHVYNFAAMTTEEGLALIAEKEGTACVRLSRRLDGTVLTADCPVGLRARVRRLRRRCVYGAVAAGLLVVSLLGIARLRQREESATRVSPFLERLDTWLDDLRVWAGLMPTKRVVVMGGCSAPPVMGKVAGNEQ